MMYMQTLGGYTHEILNPEVEMITLYGLSTSLSRICRFSGHTVPFYSVATHSLLVEDLVKDPDLKLAALLHDAHEAYWGFGDPVATAKRANPSVKVFLDQLAMVYDTCIADKFSLNVSKFRDPKIREADLIACATERRDLMVPTDKVWDLLEGAEPCPHHNARMHVGWAMERVANTFLSRLMELYRGI